jgi:cytidine deaminase
VDSDHIPWERLEGAARGVIDNSYSPYSRFRVGAAVLTDRGDIVTGVNVENASYGLTNCAERSAIFAAVSGGAKGIRAVVVFTPTLKPTSPCGACRQVLSEFGLNYPVRSICSTPERLDCTVGELLPNAMGAADLTR